MGISSLAIVSAHSTTDCKLDNSKATGVVLPGTLEQALLAFSSVLPVPITCAPLSANTRMVSSPKPELQPVTMAVFPVKSNPSVTSSAVDVSPKRPTG